MTYHVHSGYYGDRVEPFDDFTAALACYRQRHAERFGASIFGDGVDYDCDGDGFFMVDDGLTYEQRKRIEEID